MFSKIKIKERRKYSLNKKAKENLWLQVYYAIREYEKEHLKNYSPIAVGPPSDNPSLLFSFIFKKKFVSKNSKTLALLFLLFSVLNPLQFQLTAILSLLYLSSLFSNDIFIKSKYLTFNMKTLRKLAFIGMLASSLLSYNNLNAQAKRIRVVDALLYNVDSLKNNAGIPNLKVKFNNSNLTTNQEGYVDLIDKVNDKDNLDSKAMLNVLQEGNNLSFNFRGKANLEIYDILGRKIYSAADFNRIKYDFKNNNERIPNGAYFYKLNSENYLNAGMFIALFNDNGFNVYLKKNSLSKVSQNTNKNNSSENKNNSRNNSGLEKIVNAQVNLDIKDEEIASVDSVNNLGEYFDISMKTTLDSIPDIVYMIPNLNFDSKEYRNILDFIKYFSKFTNETTRTRYYKWYKKDMPIKLFHNHAQAPGQNYIDAVDSAVSSLSNNSFETMTSFNYKNYLLPKMKLFEEVFSKPDTGCSMDYSSTISHVMFLFYPGTNGLPRGPPLNADVYVANDRGNDWGIVPRETKHELGHVLFASSRHSKSPNHNIGSYQYISLDEGKAIRIIYSLPDLQDMKIYTED